MKPRLISLVALSLLSGCISNYPKDLEFKSIEVLQYRDAPELPGPPTTNTDFLTESDPYRKFVWDLIESKKGEPIIESDLTEYFNTYNESMKKNKSSRLIAKVQFKSNQNLHEYSRKNGSTVSRKQFFCERPSLPITYTPYVYYKGLVVDLFMANFAMPKEGPYIYYTYLNLSQEASGTYPYFDLVEEPEDVCFELMGGAKLAGGFRSNVVLIRAKSIIEAVNNFAPNKSIQPTPESGAANR